MRLILVSEVDGQSEEMGQAGAPPELAAGTEAALELEAQGFDGPTAAGNLAATPPLGVHVVLVAFVVAEDGLATVASIENVMHRARIFDSEPSGHARSFIDSVPCINIKNRPVYAARLRFHQTHSQPVMESLKEWLDEQIQGHRVEPNSGLGEAIDFMRRHWGPLTLFLREPGAPLDNNLCEQALKMAILHRKNSLGFKTRNGAAVGDLFMSLIQTCRLNSVNPWDYLLALVHHPDQVRASPDQWLPWNYQDALEGAEAVASATN